MSEYFILFFKAPALHQPILEKWLLEEGRAIQPETPLFSYKNGTRVEQFFSPVLGVFKVHLSKEGHALQDGAEVAVLSLDKKVAAEAVASGFGRVIKPQELDETIAHAEAASIRLPPEEA
jgi:hypothetical protein